jgi:hypothetical protein
MGNEQAINMYIQNGGKITQCPTVNNSDDRTKINKHRPQRETPEGMNNTICDQCINNIDTKKRRRACRGLCNPLLWINGQQETQEILISDLHDINAKEYKDYKDIINELAEDIELKRADIKRIFDIEDDRNKIVALSIYVLKLTKREVAKAMHLSKRQISRIMK